MLLLTIHRENKEKVYLFLFSICKWLGIAGRVGRLTRGEYYPCYSKDRYDEMTEADSLLPTLLSKYTSVSETFTGF